MADGRGSPVMQRLRRYVALSDDVPASDATLLREFTQRRDESAFAALVRRHGPMVLGVCRRILGQPADTDDAFQAVFSLLARKASSIARPELLANWLYGVALRTAWEARRRRQRQRRLERRLADHVPAAPDRTHDQFELLAVLDREVSRLSEKYRVPLVLCELQGRSRKEVAQLLGIPEGTLSSRLAAARQRLADRLSRRGVAVTSSALVSIWAEQVTANSLSTPLLTATLHAAVKGHATPAVLQITQGVLMMLWFKKFKTYTALMVGMVLGISLIGYGGMIGPRSQVRAEDKPKTTTTDSKPAPANNPLLGGWKVLKVEQGGKEISLGADHPRKIFFAADKLYFLGDQEQVLVGRYTVDWSKKPARIQFTFGGADQPKADVAKGLVEVRGDECKLGLLHGNPEDSPPESFDPEEQGNFLVFRLRRDSELKKPDDKKADQLTRERADRTRRMNSLKQIALAMHIYLDANKESQFPPAAIYDKNGKPLLSWRVAILPFLEQEELYKQFKLDEPWDSEHNKKLLEKMPKVYGSTGTTTHFRVFTGEGTVFPGIRGTRINEITDGTSNTLLVVEAAESVPWSKPDELVYDPAKPLPKLGLNSGRDGFLAVFADGAARRIKSTISEEVLRLLITVNDGQVIPDLDDK